jgi:hypothetical protein
MGLDLRSILPPRRRSHQATIDPFDDGINAAEQPVAGAVLPKPAAITAVGRHSVHLR